MATPSIDREETGGKGERISAPLAQRIRRGIEHHANHGERVEWIAEDRARVPSCKHEDRFYLVVFGEDGERCNCRDRKGDELGTCKHRVCALISWAKRISYRVDKFGPEGSRTYVLIETRAGADREIHRSTSCSEIYHLKWAIQGWEEAA